MMASDQKSSELFGMNPPGIIWENEPVSNNNTSSSVCQRPFPSFTAWMNEVFVPFVKGPVLMLLPRPRLKLTNEQLPDLMGPVPFLSPKHCLACDQLGRLGCPVPGSELDFQTDSPIYLVSVQGRNFDRQEYADIADIKTCSWTTE